MATRQFNIFVEGNDDHDLIWALLHRLRTVRPHPTRVSSRGPKGVTTYLEVQPTGETILVSSTGGWSRLGKEQEFFIREARDFGGKTLIIFDADYNTAEHESGGYLLRRASLLAKVALYDPNPELFLFPEPKQDGDLEILLAQLTQPQHQRVLDCYDSYEGCLQKFINSDGSFYYNAPSRKRRIYDYVNVMPLEGEEKKRHQQGGQKIFENPDIWNLDAPAIQPLRQFLDANLP